MTDPVPPAWTAPTLIDASLKGLCPRCGTRGLFAGWIEFAPACRICGLEFGRYNVDDGPAAFLTLILGTLVIVVGAALELAVDPPPWVYVAVLVPVTLGGLLGALRLAKAALLYAEYRTAAREGRVDTRPEP